jgi:hypothetical protein
MMIKYAVALARQRINLQTEHHLHRCISTRRRQRLIERRQQLSGRSA